MLSCDCFRNQRIKAAHEDAASEADLDSARAVSFARRFAATVRHGIHDDRQRDEDDTAEEQEGIASRRNDVVEQDSYDESEADADRECHGEPSNLDRCDQEKVCHVEDYSAKKSKQDVALVGAAD